MNSKARAQEHTSSLPIVERQGKTSNRPGRGVVLVTFNRDGPRLDVCLQGKRESEKSGHRGGQHKPRLADRVDELGFTLE